MPVRINHNGDPVCPLCEVVGDYFGEDGQACEHLWIWEGGDLIAVEDREPYEDEEATEKQT